MAVRLWAGRAGSGKSHRCFDEIVSHMQDDPLGPPIYLIVPKQETFSRERELTCGSHLSGFCRTRILSFELLAEQILNECGGQALPRVTAAGRQMMIGHVLRQLSGQLTYYTSADRQPGLAGQLETLFAELERCGSSETERLTLLGQLDEGAVDPTLLSKCKDLQLIYRQFITILGSERLDPHRRLMRMLDCIHHATCVKTARVYIDSFLEFSQPELQMIVALAEVAAEVTVTLLVDPASKVVAQPELNSEEGALFARTEQTYRRLWFALREKGISIVPERLTKSSRFADGSLATLEESFVISALSSAVEPTAIELIEASDRRGEVDCAARLIQELTLAGHRYRDIAVLARDVEEYADDIHSSFAEHRIPLFMDRRRSATHHPLIRLIRSVLQIALHRFPHDSLMGLAKTGLVNLPREHADALENYALLHRLTPAAWVDREPWTANRKLREGEDEAIVLQREENAKQVTAYRDTLINPLRPLVRLFTENDRLTARQYATELHQTLRRFKTPEALQAWIDQAETSVEDRDTHLQTWREWVALIDQLVAVIGDEPLSPSDFSNVLLTGLDQLDLALAPPTLDSVIVGSIERARGNRPKVVILLGMTDAQFPAAFRKIRC